jgi:hypothetical protein
MSLGFDPQAWRFRQPVWPLLRRALAAGVPVGALVLFDIGLSAGQLAGLGLGALLASFVAFDSPIALTRAAWQACAAPFIALAGALGALTGGDAVLATVTMTVFASIAGLTAAVSPRLYIAGASTTLALLISQGLALETSDAVEVFALGGAGALIESAVSLIGAAISHAREKLDPRAGLTEIRVKVAANLNLGSGAFRHALRWGAALGLGVAVYNLLDLGLHGYWVPLTVLFVLRPSYGETWERILMRAAGTLIGLLIATPLAELIGGIDVLEAIAIVVAASLSFALLAVEYALFTAAITGFAVIYAHALGQPAFQAADERGIATAIGLAICAVAYTIFRDRPEGQVRPLPAGAAGAPSGT